MSIATTTGRRPVDATAVPGLEGGPTTGASSGSAVASDGLDPDLRRILPLVVARLRERHPSIDPAQVARCVDEAVDRGASARVRNFLPILVERWASDALDALPRS
jgi:hypothetical protein